MNDAIAELENKAWARRQVEQLLTGEPRNARFVADWKFDGTTQATITINRRAGTFEVRPYRRRKSYTLPLAEVALLVAQRIAKAEAAAKRKPRRTRR